MPPALVTAILVAHVLTGLAGIVAGVIVVAGILRGRSRSRFEPLFLLATFASCATGFAFLPSLGVTSAQLVGFFVTPLLAVAAFATYARQRREFWGPIHALTVVGALFLNVLIATTQSFVRLPWLAAIAPTEQSPPYVAAKVLTLGVFLAVAIVAAKRAGRAARV